MSDIKISQMQPWVGEVSGNVEIPGVFANQNYRIAFSQMTPATFGFGDMALQNSDAVNITGGSIAASAIVGSLPNADNLTGGVAHAIPVQLNTDVTGFIGAPTVANTFLEWTGSAFQWSLNPKGTVTNVSALTITTSGNDISSTVQDPTTTPVITLSIPTASATKRGALSAADWSTFNGKQDTISGGTGISVIGNVVTNTAPDQTVSLTGAGTTSITGTYPNFTISSADQYSGTVTSVGLSAGSGISISGGPITSSGTITVTNTAPDQVVALTAGSGITVTGTYPNFTIASTASGGTVTSVSGTGTVNGLTLTGTVTTSGSLTLGGTLSGVSLTSAVTGTLPVANGGTGATTPGSARTNLGASTVGANIFTLTDPSAISFLQINADNSVTALSASGFRTAIGAGTGNGTVTSVAGTGTVNGITLTGTVTSSGSLTLGGTLSGVSLTTQVTGTLPVANGGTGATTLTGYVKGNGTSAFTASATVAAADISGTIAIANGGTNGTSAPTAGAVAYGTGTAYAFTAAGTAGQVLLSNGTSAPSFGGINGGTF